MVGSLDLGPLTRVLMQHEDGDRTGMVLSTSDVRAMINEITWLAEKVQDWNVRRVWIVTQAQSVHMALLDHDVALADECTQLIRDCAGAWA